MASPHAVQPTRFLCPFPGEQRATLPPLCLALLAHIAALIRQVGHEDFARREEDATMAVEALSTLRKATFDGDP